MPGSLISIGAIDLQDFEVPSTVRFGGRQRLAVHKLSGGRRVVETLGPDDGEISFRGTASGPDAGVRIRAINRLRLSGEPVWLAWDSFRYRVVVKNLIMTYQSPWWVPFRISCLVVDQEGASEKESSGLWALISADLGSAISIAAGQSFGLGALQVALSGNNALAAGTLNRAAAVTAVAAALAPIRQQISTDSALLVSPEGQPAGPAHYSSALAATVARAGSLATAVNISSYIGRINTTLCQAD